MHYIELKESLKDFTLFSLKDINKIDSRFYRSRLNEWQDKGYIRKVIKGYYIFSDLKLNENVLFEIANSVGLQMGVDKFKRAKRYCLQFDNPLLSFFTQFSKNNFVHVVAA